MNNENSVQNQNNNSVNNNTGMPQEQPIEMFDFGETNTSSNTTENANLPVQTQAENFAQEEINTLPSNDITNAIPPSEEIEVFEMTPEVEMPQMNTEHVVLDNAKKKQSSDIGILIIIIIMIISVLNMDKIIRFVENNIMQKPPTGVSDANGENLYDGLVKINDEKSGITVNKKIRFYNFQKNNELFEITLNYKTLVDMKDISEKGYYIELYNSNKDVLYKELFLKEGKHTANDVGTHKIQLDSNIFESAIYASSVMYEEKDKNKETTLNCMYKVNNAGYNELYKHKFVFKNDMLVKYDVDKSLELIDVNNASAKKAKNAIQDEYDKLNMLDLPATYENEKLQYSIDLENVTSSYIPLYKKGTTSFVVNDREEYLKWECE